MKSQTGFTLVEIAIVMIVMGFLLIIVLKGREIITNAKLGKLENQLNGTRVAIYMYQDRYRALPGDDPRAVIRFNFEGNQSGNGNNKIEGAFDSPNHQDESRQFWAHLRGTELLNQEGITTLFDSPLNPFDGMLGVSSEVINWGGEIAIVFTQIPSQVVPIIMSHVDEEIPHRIPPLVDIAFDLNDSNTRILPSE